MRVEKRPAERPAMNSTEEGEKPWRSVMGYCSIGKDLLGL